MRIAFKTPTFDKVLKDSATKIEDIVATVGGTLGLFTGFSIISGVEILYFLAKFIYSNFSISKC